MSVFQWTLDWTKLQSDLICHAFDTLPSTNTYAKSLPVESKNQLILTDLQPEGRGRGGNSWTSPLQGAALLSSWVFDLNYAPQPILAPLVGLSVFESLHEIRGFQNISLKAPNDIYMGEQKVCGILIENQTQGLNTRCIIGIGMNVLSHPHVDRSGCIQDHRSETVDLCAWQGFLIELYKRLKFSVAFAQSTALSPEICQKLKAALNFYPNSHYEDVLKDGSLKTQSQTVSWFDL